MSTDHDIVLVEGFHSEPIDKVEVLASNGAERLCPGDKNLLAVVGENLSEEFGPCFAPSDVRSLVDLIEAKILASR